MDQNQLAEAIKEEILNSLPDEAIEKLAQLSEEEGNHEKEAREILKNYDISADEIAKSMAGKEGRHV